MLLRESVKMFVVTGVSSKSAAYCTAALIARSSARSIVWSPPNVYDLMISGVLLRLFPSMYIPAPAVAVFLM